MTTQPTCEKAGERTYTTLDWSTDTPFTTQTKKVPIAATGHSWGKWTQTKDPTCTSEGELTRVCANDASHTETQPVAKDSTAHTWAGEPQYYWKDGDVKYGYVCENNNSHVDESREQTIYTKASSDLYTCENIRSELASNFAAGYKDEEKYGDFNFFFKYKNGVTADQKAYNVDIVLRTDRDTALSSMSDLFILRVDNSYKYGTGGSGSSYGLYTSDLATYNKTYSVTANDNRASFGTDYIGASFEEDFCNFAGKDIILINASLNTSTYDITVTVTYFTTNSTYYKYLGYTQTYVTNMYSDRSWNTVNSIKFARPRKSGVDSLDTSLVIESITVNNGVLDHAVQSSYYTGKSWGVEQFDAPTIMSA